MRKVSCTSLKTREAQRRAFRCRWAVCLHA